jgi:hypothetical protein
MSLLRIFRPLRPDLAELRGVVDDLPLAVRIAMLDGIRLERVIAGAYTDGRGGVCPMLAAHRHGARHDHPDFARTWDEFAEAPIEGFRPAARHHVEALEAVLRASLEDELRPADPADVPLPEAVRGRASRTGAAPADGPGLDAPAPDGTPGAAPAPAAADVVRA